MSANLAPALYYARWRQFAQDTADPEGLVARSVSDLGNAANQLGLIGELADGGAAAVAELVTIADGVQRELVRIAETLGRLDQGSRRGSKMAFQVQVFDILADQAVMSVPVDRDHLGELVAALLEVRVLLRIDVTEVSAAVEVQHPPGGEWPAALRQIIKDAHLKLPAPVAIPTDDPLAAARQIARHIAGAQIVEGAAGVAVQRPGRAAPDVLFHHHAPQIGGALN